jgi:integrase
MSVRKVITSKGEVKWEVRVYENGRGSKRVRRRFDRKIDAEDCLFQFEKQQEQKQQNPFQQSTFEGRTFLEESEYWLQDARLRSSPGHLKRVEGILGEFNSKFLNLQILKITPEFISKFQNEERMRGRAGATVDRKVSCVVAVLNHSVKHRRIPMNPAFGIRKLQKALPEMQFWDKEEATSFLQKMNEKYPKGSQSRWVYLVYLLALNTGMRAGEIWGLKVMDLSKDGKVIFVRRQLNNITREFTLTKSKKARSVPLNSTLNEELKFWIQQERIPIEGTIFRNEQGGPVFHDNFSDRKFEKDVKEWGGRRIRFHDLRHTATTLLIACGVDIKTVKEICGHADIKTTMNYIHMVPGNLDRVSQLFSVLPGSENEPNNVIKFG